MKELENRSAKRAFIEKILDRHPGELVRIGSDFIIDGASGAQMEEYSISLIRTAQCSHSRVSYEDAAAKFLE